MEFATFAARARKIEAESADTEIVAAVADLLVAAADDLPYVARLVPGEMRIGVGAGTVRDAVVRAFLAAEATNGAEGKDPRGIVGRIERSAEGEESGD
ncbi:hypothetical protein BRD17_05110 [Halobacteriales archaeon SW_7_68_16]|nr:MAG: hypothetical protein BRD17_05110 [Halobacteriales archaeon SW_7_68_16]